MPRQKRQPKRQQIMRHLPQLQHQGIHQRHLHIVTLLGAFRIRLMQSLPLKPEQITVQKAIPTITATRGARAGLTVHHERDLITTATTITITHQITMVYRITRTVTVATGTGLTMVVRHPRNPEGKKGCHDHLRRRPRLPLCRKEATSGVHLHPLGAMATLAALPVQAAAGAVASPCV
jgi:hypothetical protein